MVGATRLELVTSAMSRRRSNQLSYAPTPRNRTAPCSRLVIIDSGLVNVPVKEKCRRVCACDGGTVPPRQARGVVPLAEAEAASSRSMAATRSFR